MKKWIFIGLGAIVILLIVVVVVGISKLGPLVKMAVNTYGPKITDTELRVDDVGISIFSAEAKLKKFFLGNPAGFKSPSAMKVGSIYVDVDEGSITWRDITGGGQYDSYLACTSGCGFTNTFTPGLDAPSIVQYEVCGSVSGDEYGEANCFDGTSICDTLTFRVFPPIAL